MRSFLDRSLLILKYFTVPSLVFCNLAAIGIISNFEKLETKAYWCVVAWVIVEVCSITSFYTAVMSFFASKADDTIGASYMAALATSEKILILEDSNI